MARIMAMGNAPHSVMTLTIWWWQACMRMMAMTMMSKTTTTMKLMKRMFNQFRLFAFVFSTFESNEWEICITIYGETNDVNGAESSYHNMTCHEISYDDILILSQCRSFWISLILRMTILDTVFFFLLRCNFNGVYWQLSISFHYYM